MRSKTTQWFQVKIRYWKTMLDGAEKKVTELYTVDAMSHAEAEAKVTAMMGATVKGDLEVTNVVPAPYKEVFFSDVEEVTTKWYKARLQLSMLDENTGKEKVSTVTNLLEATDFYEAVKEIREMMKGSISDYEVLSIASTNIVDVLMC